METPKGPARSAFAVRLSEIREASGRTYGSLARRIDVSASSLHRYCSGQTVPMDFAPVERLARFCGCEGDELVTLHRLWVTADAERYAPAEPSTASSDPTTTPAGQEAAPATAAHADSAAAPGPEPRVARPRSPRGGATRSRPAHRLVYATAALLSTVTVLTLITASGDTSAPTGGRPSPRTVTAVAGPGPAPLAPTGTPETGPSPRGSRGPGPTQRPSPAASDKTVTGPGPGPAPRSATSAEPGRQPLPFTWLTDDHVWKNACDHTYLIARTAAGVPPPPAESDAEAWARSLGAVHAGDTGVRITVQGRSEQVVVLQSLRIRVTARREPLKRDAYRMSTGCGGALTPRVFDVDLDMPRPVARPLAGNDSGVPIPAVSFPYTVSATDPEVFLVTGRAAACDCDWYLELAWTSGERSGAVRIDSAGRPFRTSGARGRTVFDYDTGAHRWAPAEQTGG